MLIMRKLENNYESILKTEFCHFESSEKSYNCNINNRFLVASLLEMTVIDLFRVDSIIINTTIFPLSKDQTVPANNLSLPFWHLEKAL